jgi:hypothetical protein
MDLELTGRSALVTGASRGIGLACARALAAEGCRIHMAARTLDDLQTSADGISTDYGVDVTVHAVDLSLAAGQEALLESAGDADIVVNNAGAIPGGDLQTIDEQTWREGWELKVFGYVNLCRAILPRMESRGDGVIVNVIGTGGERPSPGYIAGAAGNAGLMAFTRALGSRSLRHGVRVVAVNPGLIVTDRMTSLLERQAKDQFGDPTRWQEMIPTDPAPGQPEHVGEVVAFLASPRAAHVSGTVVTVDGGSAAR